MCEWNYFCVPSPNSRLPQQVKHRRDWFQTEQGAKCHSLFQLRWTLTSTSLWWLVIFCFAGIQEVFWAVPLSTIWVSIWFNTCFAQFDPCPWCHLPPQWPSCFAPTKLCQFFSNKISLANYPAPIDDLRVQTQKKMRQPMSTNKVESILTKKSCGPPQRPDR